MIMICFVGFLITIIGNLVSQMIELAEDHLHLYG
jgi:hypothetical protein